MRELQTRQHHTYSLIPFPMKVLKSPPVAGFVTCGVGSLQSICKGKSLNFRRSPHCKVLYFLSVGSLTFEPELQDIQKGGPWVVRRTLLKPRVGRTDPWGLLRPCRESTAPAGCRWARTAYKHRRFQSELSPSFFLSLKNRGWGGCFANCPGVTHDSAGTCPSDSFCPLLHAGSSQ